MLTELVIRNIALIDELSIQFGDGLNVLTGETGAGKTIIIEALDLALGKRARTEVIRSGAEEASVIAVFAADRFSATTKELLKRSGWADDEEQLIIKRVLSRQGRSQSYLNGEPVSQQVIRTLAPYLIDISSQHDQQLLVDPAHHGEIVDAFAGNAAERAGYAEAYQRFREAERDYQELAGKKAGAAERLDFLKFQYQELKGAAIKIGEDEELLAEKNRMKHGGKLFEALTAAEGRLISESGAAAEDLAKAIQAMGGVAAYDPKVAAWQETLENLRIQVLELGRDISAYASRLHFEPRQQEAIEDRLHQLNIIKKKYGGTLEATLARYEAICAEVEMLENVEINLEESRGRLEVERRAVRQKAAVLTKTRKAAALTLARALEKELAELGMDKTTFYIKVEEAGDGEFSETGADTVAFLISPNVGEELQPLAEIASGGELSRVLLALKRVLADRVTLASTYVFDEVDAGVGGAMAEIIGAKLASVAKSHQVICITHLPQVARFADHHFSIAKQVKNGRTVTQFRRLKEGERVEELARMLGGVTITDTARRHAAELMTHHYGKK